MGSFPGGGFELVTRAGEQELSLSPIDVMTFDDEGRITSTRAFWSREDTVTSTSQAHTA